MQRAARISAGVGLVVVGAAMLVLPGPGLLTLAGGLVLLRKDVPAAERLLERVRAWTGRFTPQTS